MIVLGFDTATPATAVGLLLADGRSFEEREDALPGQRPAHAARLLPLAASLLERAGCPWSALERVAVGIGPGTFTGLRIGVATARGLAQSLGAELSGVSTLKALAVAAADAAAPQGSTMAVLDARRGEAFCAVYRGAVELAGPHAVAPGQLGALMVECDAPRPWLAVGDGAIRFRADLQGAGVSVPADTSRLHQVSAAVICELAAGAPAQPAEAVIPDYCRRPDAEISPATSDT